MKFDAVSGTEQADTKHADSRKTVGFLGTPADPEEVGADCADDIVLPLPPLPGPAQDCRFEMEVYARFMSCLRKVPNSEPHIRILSSLRFTADILDTGEALVSKTLVDLGLRAKRAAFPVSFLNFVDKSLHRQIWDQGTAPRSIQDLALYWQSAGECAPKIFPRGNTGCVSERTARCV